MNAVKIYNGIKETKEYYKLKARQVTNELWVNPDFYNKWYIEILCACRNKFDKYLGMSPEKYYKVATNGLNQEHIITNNIYVILYKNKEDCNKAINNLAWYLFKRDYD